MSFRQGARQFFERRGAPTPPLPYAYESEWIEADQTGVTNIGTGPFIKTAYIPQLDDDFHFYMVQGGFTNGNSLFGTCAGFRAYAFATFQGEFWYGNKILGIGSPYNSISEIAVTERKLYVNGSLAADGTTATQEPIYAMSICGFNNNDTDASYTSKFKLRGFTAHRNGVKIADYIPVVDFDGVACLYDRISESFFYNGRTGVNMGSFTAGPKV